MSHDEIVLVHSSDLHVDADPHQGPYGDDGTTGLRVVLDAAKAHNAHYVLLVGDIFDNNRQPPEIIDQCVSLLSAAGRPVIVLPGNHDPITTDSVWFRGGINELPNVHIIGVTHDLAVHFPDHDLEVWGHAHVDYANMVPLRDPRPRNARWHITLAHGHYEDDGVVPLRPSWLISNAEIEATRADYLALGHWNRAAQVGTGTTVPAYYSGSPDLAKTVNVVRLRGNGTVEVAREPIDW
ncbi:MAG: metallophosphoesterase [Acetobacteraceae bacterium]|nr:metallophosphoesterase [Pseudomonadota bacterium]